MSPAWARPAALVAAVAALWAASQLLWLGADDRLLEGDELANLGTVELFWAQAHASSATQLARELLWGDYGDYPSLYAGGTGALAAWAGVEDLDGDGPQRAGLLWAALTLAGTFALGWLRGGDRRARVALLAPLILLASPLWSALQRHLMLENGLTALVTLGLAAAVGGRWAVAGLLAGLALLTKQTALLALAPALAGLAWTGRRLRPRDAGLGLAAALAVAAPWYLNRGADLARYLGRSAGANADAVGPLHQLAYYPLVLLQQPWPPLLLLLFAALWWRNGREAGARWPLLASGIGVLILVPIPKKYPRLLLPLLPLIALWAATVIAGWPSRSRAALAGAALLVFASTSWLPLPGLGPTELGIREVDERCFQRWVEEPASPALPWDALLAAQHRAGALDEDFVVAALRWPSPPCSYQTSHDLGAHLRIRARRAGQEAWIDPLGWFDAPGVDDHERGLPDALWSDSRDVCAAAPALCVDRGAPREQARVASTQAGWPWELRLLVWDPR